MKAVVFHDIGDTRLDDVPEPTPQAPTDAIEAFKAFDRRDSGWIKVELGHGDAVLNQVIAVASPYHESRSEKPGHR